MGWGKLFKQAEPAPEEPAKLVEEPKKVEPIVQPTKVPSLPAPRPKPITRTAMGEYIVPPGGKPLTILANPDVPGPANYLPKMTLTKKSAPQCSLKGRYKHIEYKVTPGPADYQDHPSNILWKRKTVTLKGRDRPIAFEDPDASDLGPAGYFAQCDTVGKGGPKYTMAGRKPFRLYTGAPSLMIQAVDTNGFETPGPDYRPGSNEWRDGPSKSIGMPLHHKWAQDDISVGPADYNLAAVPAWDSPVYSLGKRYSDINRKVDYSNPGPNEYDLGTTVGKSTGVSVSSRREFKIADITPGPNSYTLKDTVELDKKAASITYRWLDPEVERLPGPGHYNVPSDTIGNGPAFTCRPRMKPERLITYGDGPAKYDVRPNFSDNDKPAFSMGKRLKRGSNDTLGPGPGGYEVKAIPGVRTAPEFSLAKRLPKKLRTTGPGPAQYKPRSPEEGPKHSMTRRPVPKIKKENSTPGPYRLPQGITRSGNQLTGGATFKSRASPYIYSGFRTLRIIEPLPYL